MRQLKLAYGTGWQSSRPAKTGDRMRGLSTAWRVLAIVGLALAVWPPTAADAQLSQEVRDVFEGMLEELDPDLQAKIRQAIQDDTDRIEFTPEQFLRFRSDPANPFEGLEEIDARPGGPMIALQFALPSMRDRSIGQQERQYPDRLRRLSGQIQEAARSTVQLYSGDRPIAMGVIVDADGWVLTKASELVGREDLVCQLPSGRRFPVDPQTQDEQHDLALVQLPISQLTPTQWSEQRPTLGEFLLTPDVDGNVLALGTFSVAARSTAEGERAFLGVQPVTSPGGVRVFEIRPGSASYQAGLQDGDIILSLAGRTIADVAGLVGAIRRHRPGDQVAIEYRRGDRDATTQAILEGKRLSAERAARFKMMNRLGAVPSRRDGDFPNVFQHDTPLFPEQCGGPVVDLDGRVVGINIARQGRASTLAIPAATAFEVTQRLLDQAKANPVTIDRSVLTGGQAGK